VYDPADADDWGLEQHHMRAWLLALPKPCGIMAAIDLRAKQVLDTCLAAGIRVPEEIAVVGVDNDETLCENTLPTLSSVLPDFEGGGYLAAELLDRLMRGIQKKPTQLTYGVRRLVQRQSTLYVPKSDRLIGQAVEFIRLNACAGIAVMDDVEKMNVSRRYAERHFRAACGHSILEEIQRRRLERVCALLRETHLPIRAIGERCGYDSEIYLKVLFKKRFGTTMRAYRKADGAIRSKAR
jgi:LacI family transcriptional regulator